MKKYFFCILTTISVAAFSQGKWIKIWSDDFSSPEIDNTKWQYDVGGHGFGNQEAQYYTARSENSFIDDGNLVIKAIKEIYNGNEYTSAKLITQNLGDWKYGRIEVNAQLPAGNGMWPAIWMLPTHSKYGNWPNSGEIDIMEFVGFEPDVIHWNTHTEAYNHSIGTNKGDKATISNVSTSFHEYAIEWTEAKIDFYVDDIKYFSFENENKTSAEWPFDQEFYLILNVAVGGTWGGLQGIEDDIFPQEMRVDYVNIYEWVEDSTQSEYVLTINTDNNGTITGATNGNIPNGQAVTLSAVPKSGYEFVGWTGTFDSKENPIEFSMDLDIEMNASFSKIGEILLNPTFEKGTNSWITNTNENATFRTTSDYIYLDVINESTNPWDVQLAQTVVLTDKCEYSVFIDYETDDATTFTTGVGINYDPWSSYITRTPNHNEPVHETIEYSFTQNGDEANARIYFDLGSASSGILKIYEVSMIENCPISEVNSELIQSKYISPNPVSDILYLPETESLIEILDLTGEIIKTINNAKQIHVSDLKPGIYLIKTESTSIRFIKE